MELVLSPGGGAGDAGSPFRNEDVREWSRVDRITGMLERARVETDRWQADTQDAKQSYGKMTDSRERNSADGSLVQKARRQVEIFQSQGNGGRNYQVVRASQWSSSRATDCALDVPLNKPNNTQYINDTMNGHAFNNSPRLSLWRPSLADTASDLDRLSYLCRKLHDEAMSNASFWPLNTFARTPSPLLSHDNFEQIENGCDERLSLTDRRSNSNDDLSSLLSNGDESFTRDCKARRSLQIPNNNNNNNNNNAENGEDKAESKARRSRAQLIAERAKRFEEAVSKDNGMKKSFISTKTFMPIANNDFVKNDPKHPSKFNQVAKISIQDNPQNGQHKMQVSSPSPQRRFDSTPPTRKANNKTVVHLRNAASPVGEPPRCINVTAIKLEKEGGEPMENGSYNRSMEPGKDDTTTTTTTVVNGTKPVKKVEFCKTEIHFAADSGKVNIVETDGKPPPTNKFRRRRRNHSLNSAVNTTPQKSNLPVVHFGDTSYEKYIFGGGKVPPPAASASDENKTDNSQLAITEESSKNSLDSDTTRKDRWDKDRENGTSKEIATRDSFTDTSLDKVMEHVGKFKGAHTTTVNFLSDESKALAKVAEVPGTTKTTLRGIHLQFASRSLSPIHSSNSSDDEEKVIRQTKITLHLPAPNTHQPLNNPFSNLESVQLVMNIMTASQLIDSFYKSNNPTANRAELWSLKLRDDRDDDADAARILDKLRMIEDKPSSTFTATASLPAKSQLLSNDSDQVHLKVVTTHKPVVARVDDHPASKPIRLKNQTDEEKVKSHLNEDNQVQAKEHCDNASDDDEPPVYENIFDAVSDGAPLYENFHQVVKTVLPVVVDKPEEKAHVKRSSTGSHRKVAAKISNEGSSNKTRSVPKSEKERSSSRSRDNSIKRRKDGKLVKEDATRNSQTKKSSSSVQERKGTPTNLVTEKSAVKTKKPVEVVYKTAVYNMKNEKLSKPKAKEIKGPRLINELICGTKLKKPSDSKRIIKTAIVSQNNSKKKETPTAINR